ncbi:MAG: hypothetical protein NC489_41165, partial [Ruminococcus flavefaciens]|nr:hypothetical protein [Ruminococcus flavefaciens]
MILVDIWDESMDLKSLKMAKKRVQKVYITDVAIDKVPLIQYKGFTDTQNHVMRELVQEVLTVSKNENNSNEVAITCDLGVDDIRFFIEFAALEVMVVVSN